MPKTFTLVHLSDPHLFSSETSWRDVLDWRLIGYARWKVGRHRKHDEKILAALHRRLAEEDPDHIVVTGDLTHLALPGEFKKARAWLEKLGPPEKVTLVPGNHDAYRWGRWEETFALWEPYFRSRNVSGGNRLFDYFPVVRPLGDVVLIGLSTACPNFPPLAIGYLGERQIEDLRLILQETKGSFRVLLIHHPPLPGLASPRKALLDLEHLVSVLAAEGCELVLFGHTHRRWMTAFEKTLVLGAPSITCINQDIRKRAAYFGIEIGEGLRVQVYVFDLKEKTFLPEESFLFPLSWAFPFRRFPRGGS